MNQGSPLASASRIVRIIYAGLVAGLVVAGAALYFVRRMSHVPAVEPARAVALAFAAAGVLMLVLALGALRTRLPDRRPEQDADAYWSDGGTLISAILFWAVLEGAGLVGVVGYLLTGGTAPGAVSALALAALLLFGPGRLAGN